MSLKTNEKPDKIDILNNVVKAGQLLYINCLYIYQIDILFKKRY